MIIKRKQFNVILFSSAAITIVLIATLFGHNIYLRWKEDVLSARYRGFLSRATAEIFKNEMEIFNTTIKKYPYAKAGDKYQKALVLESKLKNNSTKTFSSVMLSLVFSRSDGQVIYRRWFYPFGDEVLSGTPLFSSISRAKVDIYPGEVLNIRHILRNCPQEVYEYYLHAEKFAKQTDSGKIELKLSVEGLMAL